MDKSIAWRAYSKYLKDKGYSEYSKSGNESTVYDYPKRVNRICQKEGFVDWDELGNNIIRTVEKYGATGSEAEYGNQSNGSNIKALELFQEFYICFDGIELEVKK